MTHRLTVGVEFASALHHLHRVLELRQENTVILRVIVAMAYVNVHPLLMHVVYQEKLVFQGLANAVLIHRVKT